jgi:septum formation protein
VTLRLALASASPRRLDLLSQIGVTPDLVIATDIDETPRRKETPRAYASRLAREKAMAASARVPDHLVLAADTVVSVGRRILPKAETEVQARECLALLSARNHRVTTAIAVLAPGGTASLRTVETRVSFRGLNPDLVEAYIASGEWQGKAGGYAIQGKAGAFAARIVGSYTGIVGLPLFEVANLLRGEGYRLPV